MASSSTAPSISAPKDAPFDYQRWLCLVIPIAVLGVVYYSSFCHLYVIWDTDPNYSHGLIVPVGALFFAWLAWQDAGTPVVEKVEQSEATKGLTYMLLGLILHFWGWFISWWLIDVISLIIVLRGLLMMFGGKEISRRYAFSVLFLIFMAPLPDSVYTPLAIWMQEQVAVISTAGLNILSMDSYHIGDQVFMPNGNTMRVAAECSGLRQLTAVLALACAIGHLSGRRAWYLFALVCIALPIAMATNCIRVLLTGTLMVHGHKDLVEGDLHTYEGILMVAVSSGLVLAAAWGLARVEELLGGKPASDASPTDDTPAATTEDNS